MPKISSEDIWNTGLKALKNAGIPQHNAELQMSLLMNGELSNLPSHGILRLPRVIERIHNGVTNPTTKGVIDWFSDAMARVDGQQGLGPVVAMHALNEAMDKAKQSGVSAVAIKNCDHLGMLAFYAQHAAENGMIALCLTISEALVHPWGGRKAMLGTNPIAIGVPSDPQPFVLDLATSLVSMGKIHDYANRNEDIPKDWALDAEGNPTTDPHKAKLGAIAPFGGAKGYALGLGFEVLVTAIANSAIGTDVVGTLDNDKKCNKGDVFIVMSPDNQGLQSVHAYLDALRHSPAMDKNIPVRIPGERAFVTREQNRKDGLSIPDTVWSTVVEYAKK